MYILRSFNRIKFPLVSRISSLLALRRAFFSFRDARTHSLILLVSSDKIFISPPPPSGLCNRRKITAAARYRDAHVFIKRA